MGVYQVKREHVKKWVVKYAKVTNPYKKEMWYASVTIGYDYSGEGNTIEKAYLDLTDKIFKSNPIMGKLYLIDSFVKIVKSN